jgi:hypothetical protein
MGAPPGIAIDGCVQRPLMNLSSFITLTARATCTPAVANANVVSHAGKTLALVESTLPYQITNELETLGAYDFGGKLTSLNFARRAPSFRICRKHWRIAWASSMRRVHGTPRPVRWRSGSGLGQVAAPSPASVARPGLPKWPEPISRKWLYPPNFARRSHRLPEFLRSRISPLGRIAGSAGPNRRNADWL